MPRLKKTATQLHEDQLMKKHCNPVGRDSEGQSNRRDEKGMKSSEIITIETAAAILGIRPHGVRILMASGQADLGLVVKGRGRNSHNTYRVYRAKLARYLGRDPDYVWPEEQQNGKNS